MSGKQAKIITPGMLKRMMGYVRRSRYPRRPGRPQCDLGAGVARQAARGSRLASRPLEIGDLAGSQTRFRREKHDDAVTRAPPRARPPS
jgi:hypothetical protein